MSYFTETLNMEAKVCSGAGFDEKLIVTDLPQHQVVKCVNLCKTYFICMTNMADIGSDLGLVHYLYKQKVNWTKIMNTSSPDKRGEPYFEWELKSTWKWKSKQFKTINQG